MRHVADGALSDSAEHIDVRRHFVFSNLKIIVAAVAQSDPACSGIHDSTTI
jgi:hypothetical protein